MDVTVSAMGDAKAAGRYAARNSALGADGDVYALAQGRWRSAASARKARRQRHARRADIGTHRQWRDRRTGGSYKLSDADGLRLSRNPDFTTAQRMASFLNRLGLEAATATDPATVKIARPDDYKGNIVALLTEIEQLKSSRHARKVLIDEQSGVIVMGWMCASPRLLLRRAISPFASRRRRK
jgi:flagellar P-ring protein precursor FlgI